MKENCPAEYEFDFKRLTELKDNFFSCITGCRKIYDYS